MGEFLSYSILSGLIMLAMYLAYRLFLAKENQHSYNRGILLLIYGISFAIVPLSSLIEGWMFRPTLPIINLENIEIVNSEIIPVATPIWGSVLIWIFMAGMTVVTIKTAAIWFRLVQTIRSGKKIKQDTYILVLTENEKFAPFSWMKYIVMSYRDYNDNFSAIASHEMKHVSCLHWVDLLIAQLVCIINWFNPASWLMRDELMLVHEYQADMAVIENGVDPQQYQMLLIKKAVGSRFPSLANSLNHSKLKKRITMMYKQKSGAGRKFKALALVPMLALALGMVTVPTVRAAVSTIRNSQISVSKDNENQGTDKADDKIFKVTNINNDGNTITVTIHGERCGSNLIVSGAQLITEGETYLASALQSTMSNGVATINAKFQCTTDYENSSMALDVNGKKVTFNFKDLIDSAQTISLERNENTTASTHSPIVIHGNDLIISEGMKIYLNGELINDSTALKNLPPNNGIELAIDRQNNIIKVTLK